MIIDDILVLAASLGIKESNPPVTQHRGYQAPLMSKAAHMLGLIEDHLGMALPQGGSLTTRLAAVQQRAAGQHCVGDRIIIEGSTTPRYDGREGVVSRVIDKCNAMIRLDGETGERFFSFTSIRKVTPTMTIVSRLKAALVTLGLSPAKPTTANQAARELLIATNLCAAGDAAKKRAKKALIDLGISQETFKPGTVRLFDDSEFTVDAVTKEPSSKLDQALLVTALRGAGLSQAKITAAINSATTENKPATSIVVTEK